MFPERYEFFLDDLDQWFVRFWLFKLASSDFSIMFVSGELIIGFWEFGLTNYPTQILCQILKH